MKKLFITFTTASLVAWATPSQGQCSSVPDVPLKYICSYVTDTVIDQNGGFYGHGEFTETASFSIQDYMILKSLNASFNLATSVSVGKSSTLYLLGYGVNFWRNVDVEGVVEIGQGTAAQFISLSGSGKILMSPGSRLYYGYEMKRLYPGDIINNVKIESCGTTSITEHRPDRKKTFLYFYNNSFSPVPPAGAYIYATKTIYHD